MHSIFISHGKCFTHLLNIQLICPNVFHVLDNILSVPVNRFFPLRSNADEGPLLEGLVSSSGVVTAAVVVIVVVVVVVVVVVTGGCVVCSSGKNTCYS